MSNIRDTEDLIVSKLLDDVKAGDDTLWLMSPFDGKNVPESSYLIIGNPDDMAPMADGSPPTYEIVRYENRSVMERDGQQRTKFIGLTRGENNSQAKDWESGVDVGLGVSAEYIKSIRDEIDRLESKIDNKLLKTDEYDSHSIHSLTSPFDQSDFDFGYNRLGLLHFEGRTDLLTVDSTVNLNSLEPGRAYLTLTDSWEVSFTKSSTDWANITDYHYTEKSLDTQSNVGTPRGIAWGASGNNVYVIDEANIVVHQYQLGTSWDVTTASYYDSLDISTEDESPRAIAFNGDGTSMYITGIEKADGSSGNYVYEYSLSSGWNITSASFSQSLDVYNLSDDQIIHPSSISFESNGDYMYILDRALSTIFQFTLGTSWDISTASLDLSESLGDSDQYISGLSWKSDGSRLETVHGGDNTPYQITQYGVSTPWDASTVSVNDSIDLSSSVQDPYSIVWGDTGSKFYVMDYKANEMLEFSLNIEANLREL